MQDDNDDIAKKNIENDYAYSRKTYYDLIKKGQESLELMIEVARESEHPRAFEVLSGMIKNISDVNDRLMDLNKKNKEIARKEHTGLMDPNNGLPAPAQVTNVFMGTTTEFQKMLRGEMASIEIQGEIISDDKSSETE